MYRIQVWSEDEKSYFDAHVLFDRHGATGFQRATATLLATEFSMAMEALRTRDDLALAAEVICCVRDVATGKRHFDDADLPED